MQVKPCVPVDDTTNVESVFLCTQLTQSCCLPAYTHNSFLCMQYRIGQLYMIARHSAEESHGSGDGVEVVVNESCHDDKHGDGQYTEKRIYLSRCVVCVCMCACVCARMHVCV